MQNKTSELSEQPLRLLFVVDGTFPNFGGAETQARKLARAMCERGHQVQFLAPHVQHDKPCVEEVDGCPVHSITYPHIRFVGGIYILLAYAVYLLRHRSEYDVVHVHITRLLAGMTGLLKPLLGKPVIAKISGFFEFNGGVLDQKKRLMPLNFLIRRALRKIDYFQTISLETEEKLLAAGFAEEQIRFVPNGIDTSPAHNGDGQSRKSTPDGTYRVSVAGGVAKQAANDAEYANSQDAAAPLVIGYCGRLREVKGVHILLAGFARLLANNPQPKLILRIIGDGTEMPALRQQAKDLGVESSVEFLGMLEDVRQAYTTLDIYVQPSFAEGLPNSVIEAMLLDLPVVASNIGGNSDLVTPDVTGLLFPAGDDEALSVCLQQYLDEPELARTMAAAGKQHICDTYGFDKVVDQLLELYQGRVAA